MKIVRQDEMIITIKGEGIDCVYNQEANKLSGKGSRKFKDEIEENLIMFLDSEVKKEEEQQEVLDEEFDWLFSEFLKDEFEDLEEVEEDDFGTEENDNVAECEFWDAIDEKISKISDVNPMIITNCKEINNNLWMFERLVYLEIGGFRIETITYCNSIVQNRSEHLANIFELRRLIIEEEVDVRLKEEITDEIEKKINRITDTNPMIITNSREIDNNLWMYERIVYTEEEKFKIETTTYCNSIVQNKSINLVDAYELRKLIDENEENVKLKEECLF